MALTLLLSLAPSLGHARGATGRVEVRVTDHRAGIGDFTAFWVELAEVSLHPKEKPRGQGWVEILRHAPAVDIVPLTNGRRATVGEASVEAGDYDAVKVRLGTVRAALRVGKLSRVVPMGSAVALDFPVTTGGHRALVIDLYVEDQSDHEPGRYVVKVRDLRASNP